MNPTQVTDALEQGALAGKALFFAENGDIHKISAVMGFLLGTLYLEFQKQQGQDAADHFMFHIDNQLDIIAKPADDGSIMADMPTPDLNFTVQGSLN